MVNFPHQEIQELLDAAHEAVDKETLIVPANIEAIIDECFDKIRQRLLSRAKDRASQLTDRSLACYGVLSERGDNERGISICQEAQDLSKLYASTTDAVIVYLEQCVSFMKEHYKMIHDKQMSFLYENHDED